MTAQVVRTKNKISTQTIPEKVLNNILVGVVVVNQNWKIMYVNRCANKIFQGNKNELLGKSIRAIFSQYKNFESNQQYISAWKKGKLRHFVMEHKSKKKWLAVDILLEGEHLIITFRDITLRMLAQDQLERNERRFRGLLDKSWSVTTLVNKEGKRLYTTPSIKEILGYSQDEHIGVNAFEFIHPDDVKKIKSIFHKGLLHPEKTYEAEYRVKDKAGKYRWMEATLTNMLADPDINALVVNYHDITRRKKIEEDLIKSEERFRTLIDQSSEVIQLLSANGKILYTSDSIKRVLGYTSKELLGTIGGLLHVYPEDASQYSEGFSRLLQSPGQSVTIECRIKHKNGSWVWVEAIGTNQLKNPAIHAIVVNFRDITKQKQLDQQKDEFMGMVSHELKTPVTSLKAFAQVLQRKFMEEGNINAVSLLQKMDIQINKLTVLIADLLDVTRLDSGKLQFYEAFFSFDDMVHEVVEELQRTTKRHAILIEGLTGKEVFADKKRLEQVLSNFLSNAIKYSPQSTDIIVHLLATKKEIKCSVRDFGIGITKAKQQQVFDKFFRETGAMEDTFPGLGLGLYLSAEIIKKHEGHIWVESKKGKGSTFGFMLPLMKKKKN